MKTLCLFLVAVCFFTQSSYAQKPQPRMVKGPIFTMVADPFNADIPIPKKQTYVFIPDGVIYFEVFPNRPAVIKVVGSYRDQATMTKIAKMVADTGNNLRQVDYSQGRNRYLIMPGFIDTHIHYPQTEMRASFGEELIPWLQKFTFPTEKKFRDIEYAKRIADRFIKELLRNGTTTAVVMATMHPQSVQAFFEVATFYRTRMVAGKVLMDRAPFAPDGLRDESAKVGTEQSQALIRQVRAHNAKNGTRFEYAITPRFALSSTELQLKQAGILHHHEGDTFVHTHVSENLQEIRDVAGVFPNSYKGYLDVYDQNNLVDDTTILAHGIHLTAAELAVLRTESKKATISFCPTSNLFLGSGNFSLRRTKRTGVRVALGTDIGAGTSFSMLRTMGAAYGVVKTAHHMWHPSKFPANVRQREMALGGHIPDRLTPLEAYYLASLAGAEALGKETKIGKIQPGGEADFIVLDLHATPELRKRVQKAWKTKVDINGDGQNIKIDDRSNPKYVDNIDDELEDVLFSLMLTDSDDRVVRDTWVDGELVYRRAGDGLKTSAREKDRFGGRAKPIQW